MIETANHFNATAFLAILDNKMVTYLYKYEAPHRIVTNANIGTRKPIYSTALGKCLLAFQRKPEVIKDILKEIDFIGKTKLILEWREAQEAVNDRTKERNDRKQIPRWQSCSQSWRA